MANLTDLVARTRSGKIRSRELNGGTITITSLGDRGIETVFGVIYPPQVAVVGFGKIKDRPFCEGKLIGVAPHIIITLAADHRVSDGHRGGLFLAEIKSFLENPSIF